MELTAGQTAISGEFTEENYAVSTSTKDNGTSFSSLANGKDFDKNLWVFGKNPSEGTATGGKIIGLLASGEGVAASNSGNVYANHASASEFWLVKGVLVDNNAKFTNSGLVYAKDALGISVGTTGSNTVINSEKGVIVAEGTAAAVDLAAKTGEHSFVNRGQIIAMGEGAMGIRVTDDIQNAQILNAGTIIADEDAYAIRVFDNGGSAAKGTLVMLEEGSHIEGLVSLNQTATLSVEGVKNETIQLETTRDSNANPGDKLTVDLTGADMTFEGTDTGMDIGTMTLDKTSAAEFKLSSVGTAEAKVLSVDTLDGEGKANVSVGYTARVSDQYQKGDVETAQLFDGVKLGTEGLTSVTLDQGLMGDAVSVTKDEQGNYTTQVLRTNDLLSSAQELAMTNALMWRSQLSNLSDRMGTLRTMPETAGAWARYNNGRLDGDNIQHDYNTIEVGFDKVISSNVMLGVSFDYTKGDTDVTAGSSDNNTYTFGLYGSYFNDSGCFLDTMLKVGRIDTDYDLRTSAGAESSDYMMTGVIFGIETGHRWDIQNFFVEPQIQLTYSYLRSEDYVSNIGRHVSFDNMDSLIARVGVMGGMKFAEDRGAAYVKASYNHDFLGDVEGNYSLNGASRTFKDEMDDNWGEVSLGASYQATDSINTFIDVGTGFGGDIDQKWRVNLGARYVF
ncbi:MAG TPA: autotransporter outer membrane beta-barrel domain-containing protein [Candidatus Aphodousia gallistercoris]|nr:autotransporter outer membrane beta-barrel domain-containing protein [Candidatus Aphodousia gallistercoris]